MKNNKAVRWYQWILLWIFVEAAYFFLAGLAAAFIGIHLGFIWKIFKAFFCIWAEVRILRF